MKSVRIGMAAVAILLLFAVAVLSVSSVCAQDRSAKAEVRSAQVNINKASLETLSDLKGIGPKYAERIIQYREQHGPFKKVDDIVNVPGIGAKTLEANRGILTVE